MSKSTFPDSTISDEEMRQALNVRIASIEQCRKDAEQAETAAKVAKIHAFERAEARWLTALAAIRTAADIEDEALDALFAEETEAKRALFLTRAADTMQLWTKLELFQRDLHEELRDGPLRQPDLLLELGCIAQDLLDLLEK